MREHWQVGGSGGGEGGGGQFLIMEERGRERAGYLVAACNVGVMGGGGGERQRMCKVG